jgi:YegS/Rv2252/BmrU family lipid kinase
MKPYRVILNPAAGHGNGARAVPRIEAALARHKMEYELSRSEYPGHAIQLAREAAKEGVEVVISAGGDGTLNEIVNGLMQAGQGGARLPVIGIFCVGRGNDYAGSVGIPADFDEGCRWIKAGSPRWMDLGRVCGGIFPAGRYFINCVGVGFDAIGTIEAAKLPRWGGFLSFIIAIFKTIFLYNQAPLATISMDDRSITQRSLLISIMNGRRIGGGFFMAPNSKADDGLFDLCIADQMSSLAIIRLIPHFMRGTHVTRPGIKTGQAAAITITAHDGPLPAQTDGEIFSTEGRQISIEMLPRQIQVLCQPPQEDK